MASTVKKKNAAPRRVAAIATVSAVVAAVGAGMYLFLHEGAFTPQTDVYVFERDATQGQGDASSLVSTGSARIPLSKVFTEESEERYGADTVLPDGVGLDVTLRTTIRGRLLTTEHFSIPAWRQKGETENPARNALVKDKEAEFTQLAASYLRPVALDRLRAVVLDGTNGVPANLGKRVREVIDDACGTPGTHLLLYRITDRGYQGGRVAVDCADPSRAAQVDGWLSGPAADSHSSVYAALHDVFWELTTYIASHQNADIRADVFTDGLENTSQVSLYRYRGKPELIFEHAADLDAALNIAGLKLAGTEVHLHPLPEDNPADEALQDRALGFIAERIRKDGADTHVDQF